VKKEGWRNDQMLCFITTNFSFFASNGVRTQGLMLARQVLYHMNHSSALIFILKWNPPLLVIFPSLTKSWNTYLKGIKIYVGTYFSL
jgi:hypothetical protein